MARASAIEAHRKLREKRRASDDNKAALKYAEEKLTTVWEDLRKAMDMLDVQKVKLAKNKMAAPYRETEVFLRFGLGFDAIASLADEACKAGIIAKTGSWFSFQDAKYHGKDSLIAALREDHLLADQVMSRLQ